METASLGIWFWMIKRTVRENRTRRGAVAFGQNQNIIWDKVQCQGCVVLIVIAGNILLLAKGFGHWKWETCVSKSFILFFLQTQVLLITFSFGGVYRIYCFLPVCAVAQVAALVFIRVPSKPHVCGWALTCSSLKVTTFSILNYWNISGMRCHILPSKSDTHFCTISSSHKTSQIYGHGFITLSQTSSFLRKRLK